MLCCSIITILTAVTGLFSTGLNYGGAVAVSWGWPLVVTMSFVVALSMAEICSGKPRALSGLRCREPYCLIPIVACVTQALARQVPKLGGLRA